MLSNRILEKDTSEDIIAQLIDDVKQSPERRDELVLLLPEWISLYKNRSTNEIIRIRGYTLAAFEKVGLPETALPYVLEELESGQKAYMVAGAAKALRGLDKTDSQLISFLLKAVQNIKLIDDTITFETYKPEWPLNNGTTALKEIFQTLAWLGFHAKSALSDLEILSENENFSTMTQAQIKKAMNEIRAAEETESASCCSSSMITDLPASIEIPKTSDCCSNSPDMKQLSEYHEVEYQDIDNIAELKFEDQDGKFLKYEDYFTQCPSIVTFFYTRCNNPNKCSLTITKLARLQQLMKEESLAQDFKIAAITYDSEYDLPIHLKEYGEARGVVFDQNNRFFRVRDNFEALQVYFQLGVNFNRAIVNWHRIELFLLNDQGHIFDTFSHLQWQPQDVLNRSKVIIGKDY